MSGGPDPQYVRARRALLDGLAALEPHLNALVVVGAQAIYLHTGAADLAVAELTTDADLAIGPEFLAEEPTIGGLLESHGFELQDDPGKWKTHDGVQVDLLVPDALAGPGRRGARLLATASESRDAPRESKVCSSTPMATGPWAHDAT
ncbi:MAG: hypothetical protein H0W56_08625, partial [Acidothermales bacterium]|nr:hypothetical protein [Acidothermales bacterium]